MNRPGFSILEVLIFVVLASILSGVLYTSFWQMQTNVATIEERVGLDTTTLRLSNQLEKDCTGIFVPQVNLAPPKNKKDGQPPKEATTPADQKKAKEPEPIKPVFAATTKDNRLQTLTFITNNPFVAYRSNKPRFVRVMYRLKPDPAWPDSFILVRQESVDPRIDVFTKDEKQPREYEIADNIQNLRVEFLFPKPEEKKTEQAEQQASQKKRPEFLTVNEWSPTEKDSKQAEQLPPFPAFIRFSLALWDSTHETIHETELFFSVPGFAAAQIARPNTMPPTPQQQKTSASAQQNNQGAKGSSVVGHKTTLSVKDKK